MTEKRFILVEYVNKGLFIQDNVDDETQYFQGSKSSLEKVVDLLNSLTDENEQLKKEKERYKRLSEIRREEINNRILTIKEFINNCSDNKVRSVLKELFYSEVKEENEHIKNTIKEAYNNERTQLGKSVLKQLIEAIQ